MTFISDESSTESSTPREGIAISIAGEVIRICTGTRDVTIGGETFTAEPAARTVFEIPQLGDAQVPELVLPAKHSFVVRYQGGTFPPRYITADAYRKQAGGDYEIIHRGKISTLRFEGELAKFRMPSRLLPLLDRRLPSAGISRTCGNILFDQNCQVVRGLHGIATTVTDINGPRVKIASVGGHPDGWALKGELLHVSSGERIAVAEQIGLQLRLQFSVVGWSVGDAVEIFPGCDQLITTCHTKFSNRPRFYGSPYLNRGTPRSQPWFGVYTTE